MEEALRNGWAAAFGREKGGAGAAAAITGARKLSAGLPSPSHWPEPAAEAGGRREQRSAAAALLAVLQAALSEAGLPRPLRLGTAGRVAGGEKGPAAAAAIACSPQLPLLGPVVTSLAWPGRRQLGGSWPRRPTDLLSRPPHSEEARPCPRTATPSMRPVEKLDLLPS